MASVIWIGIKKQASLKQHLAEGNSINNPFAQILGLPAHIRPVIAKGNIIEGIEAKE